MEGVVEEAGARFAAKPGWVTELGYQGSTTRGSKAALLGYQGSTADPGSGLGVGASLTDGPGDGGGGGGGLAATLADGLSGRGGGSLGVCSGGQQAGRGRGLECHHHTREGGSENWCTADG